MAGLCQIVSEVGSSGTLLLDLNLWQSPTGARLGDRDSLKLADTKIVEGTDRLPLWSVADPSGLASRQITIPLVIIGSNADNLTSQIVTLNRLTSTPFILKMQRHESNTPMWLRCWPCVTQFKTQFAAAGQPSTIGIGTMVADTEPYAIGSRVDVGPFTVTYDTSVSTALYCDVNGVIGDFPTPAVMKFPGNEVTNTDDRTMVSVRRRGVPSSLTGNVQQAEVASGFGGIITGGDFPASSANFTSDSSFCGGGGKKLTYPAGTVTTPSLWASDFSFGTFLSGAEAIGTYRLLVRMRRAGGASGKQFTVKMEFPPLQFSTTWNSSGVDTKVIDLGLMQIPFGQPARMASPEAPTRAVAPTVRLTIVRTWSGTGTVDIDWLALIPADQDCGYLDVHTPLPGTSKCIAVDGYDHCARVFNVDPFTGSTPIAQGASATAWVGGAPRLSPGNNRIFVIPGLGTGLVRGPTTTTSVSFSYWPRYGWLS